VKLKWTSAARGDLDRLYRFLAKRSIPAAARALRALVRAPERLLARPRIGEALEEFAPREVRRILIGRYEMRYAVDDATIYILRVWHTREDR